MPSNLPESVHSAIFKAVVKVLRHNPVLKNYVKTGSWRIWDGSQLEFDDPANVVELPWIRLTPVGDPEKWVTIGQHNAPLTIAFELMIEGTVRTELMDYWAAVVAALFPGNGSVLAAIAAAGGEYPDQPGGYGYTISQPAYSMKTVADENATLGEGKIQIFAMMTTNP